jgi:serine/threonine-protein kinase HipA
MKRNDVSVYVYADWDSLQGPRKMGVLTAQYVRGKEIFFFQYEESWISAGNGLFMLDPELGFYRGKQYLPEAQRNFGIFLDSAPDRWGRLLMRRREALQARKEGRQEKMLFECDYLLGVFDLHRMGGIRFKLDPEGDFLNNAKVFATPPWTSLRELEFASFQLENDEAINDPAYENWLNILMDPGSSLGGARPKASVLDEFGNLWIAKFPSRKDDKDVGAWEWVVHQLAKACGIWVPDARIVRFSGQHHTFLTRRFDRTQEQKRIHYASAMTLLGYQDGIDYQDGVGYLDLAGFIMRHSGAVQHDLEQMWRRLLFNVLVSNTDDHLRNHGFLMLNSGWRLSPAFDINANEFGNGLTLNIDESSNDQDVDIVLDTAGYYHLTDNRALEILHEMKRELSSWKQIARNIGIPAGEIAQIQRAFRLV